MSMLENRLFGNKSPRNAIIDSKGALRLAVKYRQNGDSELATVFSALAIDLCGSVAIDDLPDELKWWVRNNTRDQDLLYHRISSGFYFGWYPFYREAVKRYVDNLPHEFQYERMQIVHLRREKYNHQSKEEYERDIKDLLITGRRFSKIDVNHHFSIADEIEKEKESMRYF